MRGRATMFRVSADGECPAHCRMKGVIGLREVRGTVFLFSQWGGLQGAEPADDLHSSLPVSLQFPLMFDLELPHELYPGHLLRR